MPFSVSKAFEAEVAVVILFGPWLAIRLNAAALTIARVGTNGEALTNAVVVAVRRALEARNAARLQVPPSLTSPLSFPD